VRGKILFLPLFILGFFVSAAISVHADSYPPDYTDSTFTFAFSGFDEDDYTNGRRKGSDSSMYLNNTSNVEFLAEPQADSQYGTGTKYVKVNYRGYFTVKPGKKYEVYNKAHEWYWDGVQVRFHGHKDLWINTVKATIKWSPDYYPESGVTVIGL